MRVYCDWWVVFSHFVLPRCLLTLYRYSVTPVYFTPPYAVTLSHHSVLSSPYTGTLPNYVLSPSSYTVTLHHHRPVTMDFDANGDPALLLSRLEELRLENDALKAAQNQHVHHHYAPDPEPTVSFVGSLILVMENICG